MIEMFSALQASVERLRRIVEPLDAQQLELPAYPSEWTIAGVLSHLGSAGIILRARLDAALQGDELADDFAQPVWDDWNSRSPTAQAADALGVDRTFLTRIESLTAEERARFQMSMGPVHVDLAGFIGLRLNEHTLHTWDIEVALDPNATLEPEATRMVIDNLDLVVQYTGKPSGARVLQITTTDPERHFALSLGPDAVSLTSVDAAAIPDLMLPAESLIRLVYGRLDHELRPTFPGP